MNFERLVTLILGLGLFWTGSSSAQICVGTPSDIVSWWPAEASSADIVDTNHGTLQDNAGYGQGVVGMGFDLDGTSDQVLVPDDPSLDLQELTLEAWVKTSTANNLFVATKSGSTGQFGYELGTHSSGRPRFTINGGINSADVWGPTSIVDGGYHHLAATYKSPRAKLYVDGVLVAQSTVPAAVLFEADSYFHIGARGLAGIPGHWPGTIDELTLYSRALCFIEIQAIFAADSAGKCNGGIDVQCPIFIDDLELGDTSDWSLAIP